jgi:hypothetical protein
MLNTGSIFSMSNQLVSPLIRHTGGDNTHFVSSLSVGQWISRFQFAVKSFRSCANRNSGVAVTQADVLYYSINMFILCSPSPFLYFRKNHLMTACVGRNKLWINGQNTFLCVTVTPPCSFANITNRIRARVLKLVKKSRTFCGHRTSITTFIRS